MTCGNHIPVNPACSIEDAPEADIIILPELWLGPDEAIKGRYTELMEWLRRRYRQGASLYSACSGAVMLAESGLLDGCPATSHWGYRDLFGKQYPNVRFQPEPNLVFADPTGRIVTAGGTSSWRDLERLLEAGQMPVDDISIESGYEDASFFRRLFKRLTGLSPGQYRRLFQPVMNAAEVT